MATKNPALNPGDDVRQKNKPFGAKVERLVYWSINAG